MSDHLDDLLRTADRGHRAEAALQEVGEVLDQLDRETMDLFRSSDIHDADGHAKCLLTSRVIEDVKQELQRRVWEGNDARREINARKDDDNGTA